MNLTLGSRVARDRVATMATVFLFGLMALVFIEFAPFRGATLGAVDVTTRQTSPYMDDRDRLTYGRNTLQTDQTDTIALAATFWRDLQNGDLRTWEPNLGTGVPLGGVVYTRVWSPLFWPGLVVPAQVLSSYAVWMALWVAQLGAWALARQLGIGRIGAVLSGVAYGFSGPVTALLLRIHETAFAPWVLLGVHCLVSRRTPRSARRVAGLSLAVAASWLGGFPAGSLFILYGAGAIALGTAIVGVGRDVRELARRLALPLAGVLVGTMLVFPLLLPSFEFLSASESLDRSFGSDHAAGLPLFGSSVSGRILGLYQGRTWWWPDRGYSNPVEASMTVGAVALLLLWLGGFSSRCRPSPEATRLLGRVYLPVGLIVFIGTFLGGPVLAALQVLPFVGSNSFGRSRFLLSLVIALAAGNVLDGMIRPRENAPRTEIYFRVLCLTFVALAVSSAVLVTIRGSDEGYLPRVVQGLTVPIICAVLAVAVILLANTMKQRNEMRGGLFGLALVVLLTIELQWGAWGFTPVVTREEGFYPDHVSFQTMRPEVSNGTWRLAGTDLSVIRPNSAAWLGLSDLRTSSPSYEGYRELMRAIDPEVFSRARLRTWFTDDLDPSSPGFDRSAVRYLVAPGDRGVLEASPAEVIPVISNKITLPRGPTAARGLRVDFGSERCTEGMFTVLLAGEAVGRQPLWQIDGEPFDIPLPDIRQTSTLEISTTGCSIGQPSEVTVLRARPDSRLNSVWALGAVVYERLDARPRIELAKGVEGIPNEEERLQRLVSPGRSDIVILDDDRPLTSLGGGSATLLADFGSEVTIEVVSNGVGYLVVRDANAPGWQATVNGQRTEILAAEHAYRAVEVPNGQSTVTMRYAPESRTVGIWIAVAAVAAFSGAVMYGRFWRERSTKISRIRPNGVEHS